ncbi:DNA topoisomerase III [Photorhabdus heterorhabditis]|uniref:DNA topoisomerase III n=1 Tax=Photorhabdus heterorhabditis TaxID=880156 RepID=UPI001BD6B230|nr:DNA topoisomerase III [Photorhabdus heterorhabditis]MBS9441252.1 DNA topoisomerase III [Photorhabdus heterorhabditis]
MKLFLCEKPSQGRDIAAVLGATKRGQGYLTGPGVTVTWAIGHLLETASPEVYGEQYGAPWRASVLPILPASWQMVVKKETADQFTVICRLLKQADEVVIATDADREGEVIARELLDYCQFQGKISRLWLSALDEVSIRAALANILPGEQTASLYLAGLGRARADWLIGMNFTRLYTVKARECGYSDILSIGRVQTPTLALVVFRDQEVIAFTAKPYWQVVADLQFDGRIFRADWVPAATYCDEEKRCIHQNVAQTVVKLCQQTGTATVLEINTKREKHAAPLAFDLGSLQQTCSKKWDMGAQQVLNIAQNLYETYKAITYPRTDCGYLPTVMQAEIPQVLDAVVKSDPAMRIVVDSLDRTLISRIWNDKKITAHHGIIPTKQPCDMNKMTDDERKVYQLIRQHYLVQFLPLHEMDITEVTFDIGGQLFRTRGNVVIVPGWKVLFSAGKDESTSIGKDDSLGESLPSMVKGSQCQVNEATLRMLQTQPPAHFTEGTLIAAMKNAAAFVSDPQLKKVLKDNAGLGTEATRAGVLDTLFKRGYLTKKGKYIHATQIASELIAALPTALTNPGLTALWEQALDDIAQRQAELPDFMARQIQWTQYLMEQVQAQKVVITPPPSLPCPVCGGVTRQRQGKNGVFWGCIKYPECSGVVSTVGGKRKTRSARHKNVPKKPAMTG